MYQLFHLAIKYFRSIDFFFCMNFQIDIQFTLGSLANDLNACMVKFPTNPFCLQILFMYAYKVFDRNLKLFSYFVSCFFNLLLNIFLPTGYVLDPAGQFLC